jgi:hypothetical protein
VTGLKTPPVARSINKTKLSVKNTKAITVTEAVIVIDVIIVTRVVTVREAIQVIEVTIVTRVVTRREAILVTKEKELTNERRKEELTSQPALKGNQENLVSQAVKEVTLLGLHEKTCPQLQED